MKRLALLRSHLLSINLIALLSLATASEARAFSYRVTPMVRSSSLYFPTTVANTESFRSMIHGELNAVGKFNKNVKLVVQPVVEYDPTAKKAALTQPKQVSNSEQFFYDFREANLQIRARPFTITLGNQIFNWGVMDGFSPTDMVNAKRLVSPLNSDKLGAPAATVGWNLGDFNLEALYIPIQRRTILPGEDSRWLPRSVYLNRSFEGYTLRLPTNLQYYYLEQETLNRADHDNFGGRFRGQVEGVDFSLVYYEGMSNAPGISLQASATVVSSSVLQFDKNVGLKPIYYRRRVAGGSIVAPIGDVILRYEGAYTQQISQSSLTKPLPGDFHEHALSLEYDFPLESGKLTAQLQATRAQYKTSSENGTTSLGRIFDRGMIAGLRYAPDDHWAILGTLVYDTLRSGSVSVLNIDYKAMDTMTISVYASIIDGQGLTPLGTYTKNDLGALNIRYDF